MLQKKIEHRGMVYLAVILIGLIASNPVWARDGRGGRGRHEGHSGSHFRGGHSARHHHGGGWSYRGYYGGFGLGFYGWPYSYPYYSYPPTVITVPVTPPVYIQQSPPATQQYPSGYWYYCNNPDGYYPYIKECPNGWQQVEPRPSTLR
jgi:hypothetical protein